MLIDYLQNADRYSSLHPGFAGGFALLRGGVEFLDLAANTAVPIAV